MLNLQNINLTLNKNSNIERQVLKNLNLSVACGEFVVIMGGNGAGKSSLFNVISGFIKPDSGNVVIDGNNVTYASQISRSAYIAKVMQDPRIGTMENMTIFENMSFALKRGQPRGLTPFTNSVRKTLFQEKLLMLDMGLENRLYELVRNLSGGERQALSLIMAVISDSKILLLDEITAALDPKIAENVIELVDKIVRLERRTCIMITHSMVEAIKYENHLVVLKDGNFSNQPVVA